MKWASISEPRRPGAGKSRRSGGYARNLEPHDVLFIDEIHRLSPVVEGGTLPASAMEDYQLDMIGEGPAARSGKIVCRRLRSLARRRAPGR